MSFTLAAAGACASDFVFAAATVVINGLLLPPPPARCCCAQISINREYAGKYQWTYRARKINGRLADENLRYYQMVEAARKMHDQSTEEWVTDTQRRRPFRRDRIFLVVFEQICYI